MHDIIVSLHMFIEEKKTSVCCASKMGGYSMMFYCLLTTANVNIFFFFLNSLWQWRGYAVLLEATLTKNNGIIQNGDDGAAQKKIVWAIILTFGDIIAIVRWFNRKTRMEQRRHAKFDSEDVDRRKLKKKPMMPRFYFAQLIDQKKQITISENGGSEGGKCIRWGHIVS